MRSQQLPHRQFALGKKDIMHARELFRANRLRLEVKIGREQRMRLLVAIKLHESEGHEAGE
jgi:hypothetical protein